MSCTAIIIGASGGIGRAIADALEEEKQYSEILRFARSANGSSHIDITREDSIEAAAMKLSSKNLTPDLVIVATGLLHDSKNGPEKSLNDLDMEWLQQNYAVNAIGPALVAKHFIPLMPRKEKCIFSAISARVGSISDNHLGGWYGYRAAKAALNMMVRNISIEWTRQNKRSIAVALHPGTVDTPLSEPFQGNVRPEKLFDPQRAALQLLDVMDDLKPVDTGRIFAWDGSEIQP